MVMPYIFFVDGCAVGLQEENQLCYAPPHPGFQCEAFLCPALPDHLVGYRPENFIGGTKFHLTKRIISDVGTIPNICPPGKEHGEGGAFCYDIQTDKPGHTVLGTWWEHCRGDERDDLAFCAKEFIDPCGPGEWEVGRDCWGDRQDCVTDCITKPAGGGECRRWGVNNCSWSPGTCRQWGCHQCTDFGLLGQSCITNHACCAAWGQELCTMNHAQCADWAPVIPCGTTCYDVPELKKTFAARNFRFESRPKESRVLAPHGNLCPPGRSENIDGLCYPNQSEMPPGYRRKLIGTLTPDCPGGKPEWSGLENYKDTVDVDPLCELGTYTRKPYPKISMGAKRKVVIEDPPDPPLPPLCSSLPVLAPDHKDYNQRLCRESDPPAGYELSGDGLSFFKKCRDLFTFNFENTNCELIKDDGESESYPNAEGLLQVDYDFK